MIFILMIMEFVIRLNFATNKEYFFEIKVSYAMKRRIALSCDNNTIHHILFSHDNDWKNYQSLIRIFNKFNEFQKIRWVNKRE